MVFPLSILADERDEAVEKAVELLKERGLEKIERLELVIEVYCRTQKGAFF